MDVCHPLGSEGQPMPSTGAISMEFFTIAMTHPVAFPK